MCTILRKTDKTEVTGYKAVIKIDGKFYSPFTGMEYTVGMTIPKMIKRGEIRYSEYENVLDEYSNHYNKEMQGKTGVFKSIRQCREYADSSGFTMLEMKLGGVIYDGRFDEDHTYIGTEILEIKEQKK